MKKNELKEFIKEEIKNILKEDLTKEQRGKNKDGTWIYPNGLKAGMSYYESDTNRVPKKNEKLDFLKYLLSYTEEEE